MHPNVAHDEPLAERLRLVEAGPLADDLIEDLRHCARAVMGRYDRVP